MKTNLFTTIALFFISLTFAQQRLIAVKGTVTDAIAKTLTEAIDLAQPGDKIYLPGGFFEHAPAIEKKVHIIGSGFQDGQNVMGRTTINGSLTLGKLANDSTFEGLYITEWISQVGECVSDNITVKRCNLKGTNHVVNSNFTNSSFLNCVVRLSLHMGYHDGSTATAIGQNNYIKSCIIYNSVHYTNSSTIENCLLTNVHRSSNSFVKKNIFYRNDGNADSITFSGEMVLADNLFRAVNFSGYNYGSTISSESNSTTYGELSDLFVSVPATMIYPIFDPTYDFHIKSGFNAPGVGIYSGSNPWKDGSLPIIPNIEKNNSYLDVQEGKFKLNVKVVPQTH